MDCFAIADEVNQHDGLEFRQQKLVVDKHLNHFFDSGILDMFQVYEYITCYENNHTSLASLPGMQEGTIHLNPVENLQFLTDGYYLVVYLSS